MKKEELLKSRQYKLANQKQFYLNNIPLDWCVRFNLSPLDIMIFCIIRDASMHQEYEAYTGSIKGLCAKTNVSLPTARSSVEKLEERGFIDKIHFKRDDKNMIGYRVNVNTRRDDLSECKIEDLLESVLARRMALKKRV